jgi:hypothetical protein
MRPIKDAAVARVFAGYPSRMRRKLMALRELIFKTASSTDGVGAIEETLKWGEPAHLTTETGSGSTIRVGWKRSNPAQYAMYFHCRTNLVETFRSLFPKALTFGGNRSLIFGENDVLPVEALSACIAAALTYHRKAVTPHPPRSSTRPETNRTAKTTRRKRARSSRVKSSMPAASPATAGTAYSQVRRQSSRSRRPAHQ